MRGVWVLSGAQTSLVTVGYRVGWLLSRVWVLGEYTILLVQLSGLLRMVFSMVHVSTLKLCSSVSTLGIAELLREVWFTALTV